MWEQRTSTSPEIRTVWRAYVEDDVLARAAQRGARIVTRPTDFFGTAFSRMLDPWGNLWWVYQHGEAPESDRDTGGATDPGATEWSDPGLAYIHRTLVETMPSLGAEPGGEGREQPGRDAGRPSVRARCEWRRDLRVR